MSRLIRGIGLRDAVAINVITMIGIGPLITIPLVLAQLAGPLALIGWIAGALVALCDGLVWAELSSRFPGSGGTYVYLREAFGRESWGRLLAFLFNWQFLLYAPFILASGYIGFANYAGYFFPAIAASPYVHEAVELGVGLLTIVLLYRRVTAVALTSVILGVAAVVTLLVIIVAALPHADLHRALTLDSPVSFGWGFLAGLGGALYITMYDYVGYAQAALLGDEVREPNRTIPRAIVLSIVIVAALYLTLQIGVLGVIPWHELVDKAGGAAPASAQYAAATVIERTWGSAAARVVTILILATAFASLFGNLLGFSRIPFAAARDGAFLPVFGRVHPTQSFPYVSLLAIGALSLVASFFTLDEVIAILTAGIVLIQSLAQIVALFVLRSRGERTPFRMWLFPVPAIVAFAGWTLAFVYTGATPILLGVGWLAIGLAVYLVAARVQGIWPFAVKATAALLFVIALIGIPHARASDAQWRASTVLQKNGYPVFTVDNRPFFVYGAAFFYERMPRSQWPQALALYRTLGINTIDLYVIWNWHEIADPSTSSGQAFDFTGRTNPRRDLVGLLKLIHQFGFKTIIRPGPVIRNEWRNGGYPAWLLERPEYAMPLHDVLEGRYPATATLQNTHADDAAAEWLSNATHMRYATRWLQTALRTIAPFKDDVIAIALDDDQGAYIDNQTWPAPHFQQYIGDLKATVQGVVGTSLPVFINTYQMKVTASAPAWAWGNWYQSDAFSIGEHDRSQLEFSTGLIGTQPHLPVMTSEFQAGWLQGADEARPRPADPTNTTLALHTMLQTGARGIVNFPVQDTLDPAGWEAPWTNAFYSWDAASAVQLAAQARWNPTQRFGVLVDAYGPYLATLHTKTDLAVAYMTSAYDASTLSNAQIAQIAASTIVAQQACRQAWVTCALVDLRYASLDDLRRYRTIVLPPNQVAQPLLPEIESKLGAYRDAGGTTAAAVTQAKVARPAAGGIANAVLLADPQERSGILDIVNYDSVAQRTRAGTIALNGFTARIPALTIPPRGAVTLPLNVPLGETGHGFGAADRLTSSCSINELGKSRDAVYFRVSQARSPETRCTLDLLIAGRQYHRVTRQSDGNVLIRSGVLHDPSTALRYFVPRVLPSAYAIPLREGAFVDTGGFFRFVLPHEANATLVDAFEDGSQTAVLENNTVRLFVTADAGARSLVFEDKATGENLFTTIGALRDDVVQPVPASARDYIAKYTHPIPPGTFNRSYKPAILSTGERASAEFTYDAPDMTPHGAAFDKIVTMLPDDAGFTVDERVDFHGSDIPAAQGAVVRSSLAATPQTIVLSAPNGYGLFDAAKHRVFLVAWHAGDASERALAQRANDALLTLTFAPNRWCRTAYAERRADTQAEAQNGLVTFAADIGPSQGRAATAANRP
ncbi:MAG: amino acid permease [Vulcanimicrobiaceae bacterium]